MPEKQNFFSKALSFVTHDVWQLNIRNLSKRKAFWIRQLKVLLITIREFNNGRVNTQASSLSFYLLLSIVPIAALIFAVSSGFGIQEQLKLWLTELIPDQTEIVDRLLDFVESAITTARGGWITGIGMVILLWSSMNMFVQIEESLNSIWQAKKPRSWARRFADYLSIMLIAPILLFLSNSITVTFKYYLNSVTEQLPFMEAISPIFSIILSLILTWVIFTLLYIVMPNVKVKFLPALTSAIIAGTVFYFVERLYIYSQVSIARYNAIYGSLAAIPLFLLCAKLGWQIVLMGAQLTFAYQNIDSYEHEGVEKENISHHNLTILSLYVLKTIVANFKSGQPPSPISKLSQELGLSVRSLNIVLENMHKSGILLEVVNNQDIKDDTYVPAMDVDNITVGMVLKKLESVGETVTMEEIPEDMERISLLMEAIYNHIAREEGQIKIIDL